MIILLFQTTGTAKTINVFLQGVVLCKVSNPLLRTVENRGDNLLQIDYPNDPYKRKRLFIDVLKGVELISDGLLSGNQNYYCVIHRP